DLGRRLTKARRPRRGRAGKPEDLAQEELRRAALDLVTNGLLRGQDTLRRHTDGAVVEIRHVRIERKFRPHIRAELHAAIIVSGITMTDTKGDEDISWVG